MSTENKRALTITAGHPYFGMALNSNAPPGVRVMSPPMMSHRNHGMMAMINVDIKIVIDLTEISTIVFAAWFVRQIRSSKANAHTRVNGKSLPDNDADAIELITQEIESKK